MFLIGIAFLYCLVSIKVPKLWDHIALGVILIAWPVLLVLCGFGII